MRSLKRMLYAWIDKRFLGGCSNYNSLSTRKSCRSKKQARDMFAKNGIPHAKGIIFYGPVAPVRFVMTHGFPVVIKPNVSGFSRGSYFPITTWTELFKAMLRVKIWWPSSVIEQYLEGKNYRIAVVKDDIMSVIRRYPPFITGDGQSTIAELIDRENRTRKQMGLLPVIHTIDKNARTTRFLKNKGLSLSSVPSPGENITLHNRIALAPGGVVETIDKERVHKQNQALLMKILPLFNANILGIDAIFEKGIEYPYTNQRVIFLEVNSRPYLKMHDYPRYGEKQDLSPYLATLDQLAAQLPTGQKDIF